MQLEQEAANKNKPTKVSSGAKLPTPPSTSTSREARPVAALTSDVKPSDAKTSDTNYTASDNVGKTTAATSGSPTSDRAAIAVTADAACDAAATAAKTTIAASDDIATQALSTATSGSYASGTPEGVEHDDEFDKEYVIPLWRHVMLPQPLLRYTLSSPDESYHPCCTPAVAWR